MAVETNIASATQLTQDEVIQRVAEALGVPPSRLNAESAAGDLVEWDSMGILSILTAVGREGVAFDPNDITAFQSMDGVLELFRAAGRLA